MSADAIGAIAPMMSESRCRGKFRGLRRIAMGQDDRPRAALSGLEKIAAEWRDPGTPSKTHGEAAVACTPTLLSAHSRPQLQGCGNFAGDLQRVVLLLHTDREVTITIRH